MFIKYNGTNIIDVSETDYTNEYFETELSKEELVSGNYFIFKGKIVNKTELDNLKLQELQEDISSIKIQRNVLLNHTDKFLIPDFPISSEKKEEWKVYRQALRDLEYKTDPMNVVWPILP